MKHTRTFLKCLIQNKNNNLNLYKKNRYMISTKFNVHTKHIDISIHYYLLILNLEHSSFIPILHKIYPIKYKNNNNLIYRITTHDKCSASP